MRSLRLASLPGALRASLQGIPLTLAALGYAVAFLVLSRSGLGAGSALRELLLDLSFVPFNLLTTWVFWRAARRPRIDPALAGSFGWLAAGMACVAVGSLAWTWMASRGEDPTSGWANLPSLLFYPLAVAGFLRIAPRRQAQGWKLLLDLSILLLSTGFIVGVLVVRQLLPTYYSTWQAVVGLAYPVGDLALLVVLLGLFLRPVSVVNPVAFAILCAGFGASLVADLVYQVMYARGAGSGPTWVDPIYVASYLLMLWGGELYCRQPALPPRAPPPPADARPSPLPLIAAAGAALLVLVVALRDWHPTLSLLAIGLVALGVLLLLRETLAVRETARLLAVRTQRASALRFEALVRHASDVIMVVDEAAVIRFVSPAVERALGRRPESLLGHSLYQLVHPDDMAGGEAFVAECLLRPSGAASIHWRMRHQDGQWRVLETVAANLLAEPSVGGVVLTLRDVTERDLLEEQFRQAQKMEAIGQLAGGVAHDFNNLLTTVLASSDIALDQLGPDSPARADIEEIRHAATRAAALTGQLLALSRKQMVEPRSLDLGRVVAETSRLLQRLLGESVRLATEIAGDLGAVRADRGQVDQVLLNLAVNARDAMPGGGTLTIVVRNVTLAEPLSTRFMEIPVGEYVRLGVRDTGEGMDEATVPHIFEPFFTTKPLGKGTGLGLASVYGIVRQSGGSITVESVPGRGTEFQLYFPRIAADAGRDEVPAVPQSAPGTETVLLVEDEAALRAVGRRILLAAGYTVLAAADAEEALRLAAGHPGEIHLLLSDVIMPGETGPVLARRLQRLRPGMAVLYMSGYAGDELGDHGVLDSGVALLQKPFSAWELTARVRAALTPPE
jgi:PAS domain S-box-containing protein